MQGDRGGTTGMVEAGGWLYYGGTSTSYSSGRIMRVKADGSTGAEIVLTFSWYEGYPAGNGEPELFGGQPVDGLVLGDDGLLYGVTSGSLTGATGTLFALDVGLRQSTTSTRTATSTSRTATRTATRSASRTATRATFPAASPTVLFRISADLGTVTGIAEAPDGNFLGVARGFTGLTTANECGTLFSITPSGAFSVVHLFQDDGAGCFPETVPVYSSQCNCFYGTTSGRNGEEGTPSPPKIWALDAAGTVRAIATLPSGSDPMGRLAVGSDGTLYGALNQGGSVNDGAIFRLRPGSPAPEVFYQLARPSTGYRPVGGVSIGGNDTVYVTTLYGRTALNGTLLALWSDGGWSESQFGFGSMALDPPLAVGTDVFGLLSEGGPENCGSAYRWRRYVGSEQLFVFRGPSGVGGCTPRGPLIQIGGDLYGTTAAEIFRFPSSGDGGWAAGFANYSMADRDGIVLPLSGVLQGADGRLYGLAGPENEERTFYAVNLGLGPARQTTVGASDGDDVGMHV
ncbi:hypothetical protein DFJ74DRAFT_671418 [Hyaloraphidium curvatum]|nr:hypothetical protein DFJ74DRAFT_671418 [Hyaloraphidium curvatum]